MNPKTLAKSITLTLVVVVFCGCGPSVKDFDGFALPSPGSEVTLHPSASVLTFDEAATAEVSKMPVGYSVLNYSLEEGAKIIGRNVRLNIARLVKENRALLVTNLIPAKVIGYYQSGPPIRPASPSEKRVVYAKVEITEGPFIGRQGFVTSPAVDTKKTAIEKEAKRAAMGETLDGIATKRKQHMIEDSEQELNEVFAQAQVFNTEQTRAAVAAARARHEALLESLGVNASR